MRSELWRRMNTGVPQGHASESTAHRPLGPKVLQPVMEGTGVMGSSALKPSRSLGPGTLPVRVGPCSRPSQPPPGSALRCLDLGLVGRSLGFARGWLPWDARGGWTRTRGINSSFRGDRTCPAANPRAKTVVPLNFRFYFVLVNPSTLCDARSRMQTFNSANGLESFLDFSCQWDTQKTSRLGRAGCTVSLPCGCPCGTARGAGGDPQGHALEREGEAHRHTT